MNPEAQFDNERAFALFREQVEKIENVGEICSEWTLEVWVDVKEALTLEQECAVYQAEMAIHQTFPGHRLHFQLRPRDGADDAG